MHFVFKHFCWLVLAVAVGILAPLGGCAVHARVYDPYYHDYHRWDGDEIVFYSRWEGETHREHRDFRERNEDERKEYWEWRHGHGDHDRDRDHDHDRDHDRR